MLSIKKELEIKGIPAILWGISSRKIYLYVHGQGDCKEEAEIFAEIACRLGCQVLSMDLPKHGERINVTMTFEPWKIIPELSEIMKFVKSRWKQISLY